MSESALTAIAVASLIRSIQEISSELKRINEQLKSLERTVEKQRR
jgi:predicted transcriptional regulator